MSGIGTDLRIALRGLAANPGFAALAVLTMALGIGINTAMFTFADGVLLKPLDYRDAGRLVFIWEVRRNCNQCLPSPPTYVDWKTQNTVFSHVSAYTLQTSSLNLTGAGPAEQILARHVSTDYFEMLGVRPALGRSFQDGEDQVGAPGVAVLCNQFWRRKFGADADIAGKTITLDGQPHTVAGVLPAGVFDRLENEVWLPLVIPPDRMRRNTQFFAARARLKPGVTVQQADGEMKRLARALNEQHGLPAENSVVVSPLRESIVGPRVRTLLGMLMGAVAFVLLIATVNVANLMLARSASRRREMVIRAVLGAGRLRLARQFLAEGLLLAVAGGLAGVLLAVWLVDALRLLVPPATLPQETVITMDTRVLLFAALMSLGTGIVVGLLPAVRGAGRDLAGQLKEHGSAVSGRFVRDPVRATLLTSEVALTVVLLVGASLMLRSFFNLLRVDPGFRTAQVLTFRTTLSDVRFPTAGHVQAYQSGLLARLGAIPGVTAASFSNALPMTGSGSGTDFSVRAEEGGRRERGNARIRTVDPAYFSTLGLRPVQGRLLTEQDTRNSPLAVVVNQTLARQYLPGNPLGRQVLFAGREWYTVVGVVADTKHNGPAREAPNEIYVRWQQLPPQSFQSFGRTWHFIVRTSGDPAALAGTVQSVATAVDPEQPVFSVRTLDDVVQQAVAEPRLVTALFLLFGFLALGLAAVGLFGVLAYLGTQRAREMAIRMALGAQVGQIWRLVIGQGLKLTLAGVLVGLGAAVALVKLLSSLLFEIQPYDPLTFLVVPLLLGLVAVAAGLAPALRAGRVDPVVALRQE